MPSCVPPRRDRQPGVDGASPGGTRGADPGFWSFEGVSLLPSQPGQQHQAGAATGSGSDAPSKLQKPGQHPFTGDAPSTPEAAGLQAGHKGTHQMP